MQLQILLAKKPNLTLAQCALWLDIKQPTFYSIYKKVVALPPERTDYSRENPKFCPDYMFQFQLPLYTLRIEAFGAVMGGFVTVRSLKAPNVEYAGINSSMGMLFCATGFIGFIAFTSCALVLRGLHRRRDPVFFSTLLLVALYYPLVGFTGVKTFFAYWLHLSMHVLLQVYFGQFMSYLMPAVEVASIFGTLSQMIFFLFLGFNPPASAIPTGYKWLYHITPHKYSLALVASLVFGDCPSDGDGSEIGCRVMAGAPPSLPENMTVKEYMEDVFLMKHSEIWENFGSVLGFIFGNELREHASSVGA
ncbi:hypothetical protein PHYSODRAFT_348740 [Phytophthora sojae]|uniref:ABC-2 type transporter transmembrane domain-containing protein n=1 Tax=Phytophthora sojae (strain P6497) TaxID=1094619 RepID=G5AAF7_PHYSP|nr:hypothetical protein PHYSODRAFT_348245 [Phytophthora sojae]XP_009540038.1 hypothetical protein PHYSODRAFT_348740 [Phytophthora sojae]EGZ04542.1 hypothetical protein PHYSODRAFT_348740 [Phytophthora sojae]EGZ07586.1 hypothetical protein PHYSODRAFT_348245 [Phytophthora sojae]|eukprot:XP_009537152.1 hypothetical protein PHYSODRAFT_348245 [Phytophthora sojae]